MKHDTQAQGLHCDELAPMLAIGIQQQLHAAAARAGNVEHQLVAMWTQRASSTQRMR